MDSSNHGLGCIVSFLTMQTTSAGIQGDKTLLYSVTLCQLHQIKGLTKVVCNITHNRSAGWRKRERLPDADTQQQQQQQQHQQEVPRCRRE